MRLWDLESGDSRPLEGHSGPVAGATLLADSRRALSWSYDATLRLWDLESGDSQPLEGHSGWVDGAALLPDGRRALSWSRDATLRLWDLERFEELAHYVGDDPITWCVVSEDSRVAVASDARGRMAIFDLTA